ncbi:metallophosphoesterase, partial [Deltaproteobacteria bacterium OttesenSCG-928-M10]|nr:metallophosphoesterase [Deltaproteobacteria bacterium OttesenSCG-928-M10]
MNAKITFLLIFAAVSVGAVIFLPACTRAPSGRADGQADFTLTVLHTNDTHSTYGGTTAQGLACYAALCEGGRGGYVRLDQAVRAVRKDRPEALFMDAGDIFQGTLFWTLHKERMPAALIDRMGYQAVIPGNHAFDDGWPTWLRLVKRLKTPVLAANISFDARPAPAAAQKLKPYIVLERGGRKIGVVGLLTQNTLETSSPGPGISFGDVRAALESAVEELTGQGVNIIIALTHLGLENDRRLARAVKGVDLIVGGHSHSFLSSRDKKAEGPYPIVEKAPDRKPVLVVSAATACAYLGRLDLGFDAGGVARTWRGEPIPLDEAGLAALGAPEPDAALVKLVDGFAVPVQKMIKTRLGSISADSRAGRPLEEPNVMECRRGECLTG